MLTSYWDIITGALVTGSAGYRIHFARNGGGSNYQRYKTLKFSAFVSTWTSRSVLRFHMDFTSRSQVLHKPVLYECNIWINYCFSESVQIRRAVGKSLSSSCLVVLKRQVLNRLFRNKFQPAKVDGRFIIFFCRRGSASKRCWSDRRKSCLYYFVYNTEPKTKREFSCLSLHHPEKALPAAWA